MPYRHYGRENARLIRPTRNHAQTEYNLRYKRWPQHGANNNKSSKASSNQKKAKFTYTCKKSPETKTKECTTDCKPGCLLQPNISVEECEKVSLLSSTNSFVEGLCLKSIAKAKDLKSTLQTTPIHLHSRSVTPADTCHQHKYPRTISAKSHRTEPKSRDSDSDMSLIWDARRASPPLKPKSAWLSSEEIEESLKMGQNDRYYNSQHSPVEKAGCAKISISGGSIDKTLPSQPPSAIFKTRNYGNYPGRKGSIEIIGKKSFSPTDHTEKDWHYYFQESDCEVPRLKPGGKVLPKAPEFNAFKRRKDKVGNGIDERSLRKVYTAATDDELKKLAGTLKSILGNSQNTERATRRQYASHKNDYPPGTKDKPLHEENIDHVRRAAFKVSKRGAGACHQDMWKTSYEVDFCNIWQAYNYKNSHPNPSNQKKSNDDEIEVREHFVSADFPRKRKPAGDESDDSAEENKSDIDKEEQDFGESGKVKWSESRTEHKKEGSHKAPKTVKMYDPKSDDPEKVLKDVRALEQKEYKNMLAYDGKPKMKLDTTSGETYKGVQPEKEEEPVWANKTMVSLGSGHWNLLLDYFDGWGTKEESETAKRVQAAIPKKSDKKKYKIKVYEQGDPESSEHYLTKKMVMGKYGGDRRPMKTSVNYLTEYMTKFTRLPLPRKAVRV